jgi:hypothetical protein
MIVPNSVKRISIVTVTFVIAAFSAAACAPEVGSERWCNAMRDKPRGDWSANEALDFTRHCLLSSEDE